MIVVLVLLSWLCIQARSRAGGSIFGRANSDGFVTTVRGRGMERLFEPRLLLMVRVAFQLISRNCFSTEMFVSQVTALKAQEIYMQELQEKGSMGSGGQSSILPSINRVVSQKIPILLKNILEPNIHFISGHKQVSYWVLCNGFWHCNYEVVTAKFNCFQKPLACHSRPVEEGRKCRTKKRTQNLLLMWWLWHTFEHQRFKKTLLKIHKRS